jgi:transcriptional regulator with XRE-family HTH domain
LQIPILDISLPKMVRVSSLQIPVGEFFATVDAEDFEMLSEHKWHPMVRDHTTYASANVRIDGRNVGIRMHRMILGLTDPRILVDHKDRNGLNNRRTNLRVVNHAQNSCNSAHWERVAWAKKQGPIGDPLRRRIRAERERLGWSQAQLAEALTKHQGSTAYSTVIAKIESGSRAVRAEELVSFAEIFSVSCDALLGRKTGIVDIVWAVSKLASNAEKMISEVAAMRDRLSSDLSDLLDQAERDGSEESMERARPLLEAGKEALDALDVVMKSLAVVSGTFPLPRRRF